MILMDSKQTVMPGETLATEEEYIPGTNAYVENGHIYAAAEGVVSIESGVISVRNAEKNISPIKEGMYVLGAITDDMRTVQFVKIDDIVVGSRKFIAMKNGKIVAKRRMGPDAARQSKPCLAGDVVLARVDSDKEDTYELDLYGRELGVVFASCAVCGRTLDYIEEGSLRCSECKRNEHRNTSALYGDAAKIEEELGKHALAPVKRQRPQFRSEGSRPPFRRGGFREGGGDRGFGRGRSEERGRERSGERSERSGGRPRGDMA